MPQRQRRGEQTPQRSAAHRFAAAAAWLAIVALYLALRVPLLDVPLERDEGAFAVVGEAILRGEVPYRDVFDHKPPGVYYIFAAALPFIPHTARGVHLLLLGWNLATLACVASIAAALAGPLAGRWAGLVFAVVSTVPSLQGFSTTSEMLLLLPLVGSIRLTIAALSGSAAQRTASLAAAGAIGAVACWIKQPAAFPLLIAPLLIATMNTSANARMRGDLIAWFGGAAAFSLAVTASFVLAGAWDGLWYWTVTHNWLYVGTATEDWVARLAAALPGLSWEIGFPIAAGVLGSALALRRQQPNAWVGIVLLALSLPGAMHSRFLYLHYFAIAAPAVAVVAGFGIAQLQRSAQEKSGPIASATVAAVAVGATLGLPMIKAPWYWLNPDPDDVAIRVWGLQGFEAYAALGAYLHDHSQPDDRILIYGSEPQVSFLAGRRNANPFTTIYPLTGAWPRQREFQERLWAAIELAPPRYVLLAQQWQSLLADDNTDPFFESKLADVLLKQYAREYFLIYEGNRVSTLPGPDLPAGTDQGNVLMDVWRRN